MHAAATGLSKLSLQLLLALLVTGSLVSGAFFQGLNSGWLVLAQGLMLAGAAMVLWAGYQDGWRIPLTPLTVAVTLWWVWMVVTLVWSPVPAMSTFMVWWLGSLPLAYWLGILSSRSPVWWQTGRLLVLVVVLVLALAGVVQFLVYNERPQLMFLNRNAYAGLLAIVTVPAAAAWLRVSSTPRRAASAGLSIGVLVLVYTVALTQGRGVLIALLVGLIGLVLIVRRITGLRQRLILLALAFVAVGLANFHMHGDIAARFGTLQEPLTASIERLQIWQGSLELLRDSPWWGIGLGIYSLVWPPYRHPEDLSAGHFAHNDYLQIWIEAGLPGVLLFTSILFAFAWLAWRLLRAGQIDVPVKIEIAGLAGGVGAVALHSLVDFNFYVVPTLILTGLMLARATMLAADAGLVPWRHVAPARGLSAGGYRAILGLLFAFPFVYFSTLSLALWQTERSLAQAGRGDLAAADESLARARRYFPEADNIPMSHADLYRHALATGLVHDAAERQQLFDRARQFIDEARTLNPYRVLTLLVQARLCQENPDLTRARSADCAVDAYEQALQLNPRLYETRYLYAQYLLSHRQADAAHRLVEEGLRYTHRLNERIVPYLALAARLRREHGDHDGAQRLQVQIEQALAESGWQRVEAPSAASTASDR